MIDILSIKCFNSQSLEIAYTLFVGLVMASGPHLKNMKLYANVSSERATKGQGGNNFLKIEVTAEGFEGIPTRANLYRLSLSKNDNDGGLYAEILKYCTGEIIVLDNIKGKKQKD